jgi:hypothetical protein
MKSLSAAIVIVAGLQTLVTSSLFISSSDTRTFISGLGVAVVLIGLLGWIWSMRGTP